MAMGNAYCNVCKVTYQNIVISQLISCTFKKSNEKNKW